MGHRISRHQSTTLGTPQSKQKKLAKGNTDTAAPAKTKKESSVTTSAENNQISPSNIQIQPSRVPSATVIQQQQFQSVSQVGSVVITIRMLKMEPNDFNEFMQQHQQHQQQSLPNLQSERITTAPCHSFGNTVSPQIIEPQFNNQHLFQSNMAMSSIQTSNDNVHATNNNLCDTVTHCNNSLDNNLLNNFGLPSKQFNCDMPNSTTASLEMAARASLLNVAEQNVAHPNDRKVFPASAPQNLSDSSDIEFKITNISLTEQNSIYNIRDIANGLNNNKNDNNNVAANAAAAEATRLPFELLDPHNIFTTTLLSATNALNKENSNGMAKNKAQPSSASSVAGISMHQHECEHECKYKLEMNLGVKMKQIFK